MISAQVQTDAAASPIILDIEASGFGRNSYPVEVGFALPNGRTYCTLVRPESGWTHWDWKAAQTHHITRDLIERRGLPASKVAEQLNLELQGQTAYTDGWANDYSWLAILFEAAQTVPRFQLDNLRKLLTEQEAELWHTTKSRIAAERGAQRHRASSDARLLQLTLQRLRHPQ